MKKNIAVLPGDGIGPEVTHQSIKVLKALAEKYDHEFSLKYAYVGAEAILHSGSPLPESTLDICHESDAILFGAIGDPSFDKNPDLAMRPEQGLLRLRKELELFGNLRPIQTYEALYDSSPLKVEYLVGVDILFCRELTGGIYFGDKGLSDDKSSAFDVCQYTTEEVRRIVELSFSMAYKRNNKVTLVDKANVLECSRLWRRIFSEVAMSHSDIETDYMFVDNAAYQLILNPQQFDVIVTSNMFGDILSDEASILAGSLGLLPSASIGTHTALFEPIHGSYPQAKGEDIANPIGSILSLAMMMEYLDLHDEAADIRSSVNKFLTMDYGTPDLNVQNNIGCNLCGEYIAALLLNKDAKLEDAKSVETCPTII